MPASTGCRCDMGHGFMNEDRGALRTGSAAGPIACVRLGTSICRMSMSRRCRRRRSTRNTSASARFTLPAYATPFRILQNFVYANSAENSAVLGGPAGRFGARAFFHPTRGRRGAASAREPSDTSRSQPAGWRARAPQVLRCSGRCSFGCGVEAVHARGGDDLGWLGVELG